MSTQLDSIISDVISLAKHDYVNACEYLFSQLEDLPSAQINNLGLGFYQKIEYELCKKTFEFLLNKEPNNHPAHNNIGLTLNRLGQGEIAVKHYQKAIEVKPDYHQARSNLAYTSLYFGETDRTEILNAHKNISKYVFNNSVNYLTDVDIDLSPQRKLNIGYISSDFRNHAVGRFIYGILQHHDMDKFNIHVFDNRKNNSDLASNDETTQSLKAMDNTWHDISKHNTKESCQLIIQNEIDILIDLSGHTQGGRPDILCNRIAPIQINYLGYPATSGMPTIDYRIGDLYADLEKYTSQNTEKMLRLDHAMWNYTPWPDMPKHPTPSPFHTNKRITFGSANNHAKIQIEWLEVWAKVLKGNPESLFKIKSRGLKSPSAQRHLLEFFTNKGIDHRRIDIKHYSPTRAEHWRYLSQFDIALDTFPYNGTTTTCDLLTLGIPIITRSGNSHVSRTTGSILSNIGLNSWIAQDENEFIDICHKKAADKKQLKKLRQSLKERLSSTSLGHSSIFMIDYEHKLTSVWNNFLYNSTKK